MKYCKSLKQIISFNFRYFINPKINSIISEVSISGILCIVPVAIPLEINDLEINWDSKINLVNPEKSIVIDNTGLIHFYIGGMDENTNIHYCNIHNEYEEVMIEDE